MPRQATVAKVGRTNEVDLNEPRRMSGSRRAIGTTIVGVLAAAASCGTAVPGEPFRAPFTQLAPIRLDSIRADSLRPFFAAPCTRHDKMPVAGFVPGEAERQRAAGLWRVDPGAVYWIGLCSADSAGPALRR